MSEYRNVSEVIYNSDHSKFVGMECNKAMAIMDVDAIHSKLGNPKDHYMLIESKHLNESIKSRQLDGLRCLDKMFKGNAEIEYHGGWISFAKFSKEKGFEVAYMCSVDDFSKVYHIDNAARYIAICEMKISPSRYNIEKGMLVVQVGKEWKLVNK